MSIKLDEKTLYKKLWFNWRDALPLALSTAANPADYSYDGEEIRQYNPLAGWPAMVTGQSIYHPSKLRTGCVLRAPDPTDIWFHLQERAKAIPSELLALRTTGATYETISTRGGVSTVQTLTGQDWSVRREFQIRSWANQTQTEFYVDGAVVSTHTTNIPAQPFEPFCAEPRNVVREIFLKYPKGVFIIGDE